MGVAQDIRIQVQDLAEGVVFKYDQLAIDPLQMVTATKAMQRLVENGLIRRVSPGKFYKPSKTRFGELKPAEEEILKPYLFLRGRRIAYVTGLALYHKMGLTTQIPVNLSIASRDRRITVSTGTLKAMPVKSYVDVTDENFRLLELLDAMKDLKQIPDLDIRSALKILGKELGATPPAQRRLLIDCALAYPPRVRALLGALMEKNKSGYDLSALKGSLNPLSEYNFGINKKILPSAEKWRIR